MFLGTLAYPEASIGLVILGTILFSPAPVSYDCAREDLELGRGLVESKNLSNPVQPGRDSNLPQEDQERPKKSETAKGKISKLVFSYSDAGVWCKNVSPFRLPYYEVRW